MVAKLFFYAEFFDILEFILTHGRFLVRHACYNKINAFRGMFMKYVISLLIFYAIVAFCIVMTVTTTEDWFEFVMFSLVMCMVVTFYIVHRYHKDRDKKEEDDDENQESDERDEDGKDE